MTGKGEKGLSMPLTIILLLLFGGAGYYGFSKRKRRGEVGIVAPALLIALVLYAADALR
jgi:hypothetical protein